MFRTRTAQFVVLSALVALICLPVVAEFVVPFTAVNNIALYFAAGLLLFTLVAATVKDDRPTVRMESLFVGLFFVSLGLMVAVGFVGHSHLDRNGAMPDTCAIPFVALLGLTAVGGVGSLFCPPKADEVLA
jgi:Kef-type K+ transport system membrane component KefB